MLLRKRSGWIVCSRSFSELISGVLDHYLLAEEEEEDEDIQVLH